jgi:segregation and condensation protein B
VSSLSAQETQAPSLVTKQPTAKKKKPSPAAPPAIEVPQAAIVVAHSWTPLVERARLQRYVRSCRTRNTTQVPTNIESTTVTVTEESALQNLVESNVELKKIIEAILFSASQAMTPKQLQHVFTEAEQPELAAIQHALAQLAEDYQQHALELKQVASGFRFQIRAECSPWITRLFLEKPPRYSRALLETLAIIAYRQPVTRADIEDIRGVGVSSSIIQTLMERDWIKVVGHKEVPGRPALLGTTKQFLDYFNLLSLDQLPTLQSVNLSSDTLLSSEGHE